MTENRAFNEMLKAARSWLNGLDPCKISRKSGIHYDEAARVFRFMSLGREIELSYPEYNFNVEISEWHRLVILHYLYHADGFPPSGSVISFSQLRDGLIRGGGFDRNSSARLSAIACGRKETQLRQMLMGIGGTIIDSRADLCARIDFLPRYPLHIHFYLEDEEFPAEGRMLLDKHADHYLPVEDAVTVGSIILEALEENA